MNKRHCYLIPMTAALLLLSGSGTVFAQANDDSGLPACDDKDERDRSRSSRRRSTGSNRDCEYRETTVDEDSGEVLRETPVVAQRNVLPRYYSKVPRPTAEQYVEAVPIPDRWRIVDSIGYEDRWFDPYNQNTFKGDKPLYDEWFFSVSVISDTVVEFREVPTPVGLQSTDSAGSLDVLGGTEQALFNQNLAVELVYLRGDTVFRPPDWEFRFTPVFNYNYTELDEILGVNADPGEGRTRNDSHVGIQAAFVDYHIRNVSSQFDFDSIRVGIQPFSSDFRGFLFQDSPFGVRLFGNRNNNVFQYNLAWFRRMGKDTNSGLNDVSEDLRDDDLFIANLYWQDLFVKGFFSEFSVTYNRNRETVTQPHLLTELVLDRMEFLSVVDEGASGDANHRPSIVLTKRRTSPDSGESTELGESNFTIRAIDFDVTGGGHEVDGTAYYSPEWSGLNNWPIGNTFDNNPTNYIYSSIVMEPNGVWFELNTPSSINGYTIRANWATGRPID